MDAATKQRLDELMPWYVTGQTEEDERAWVEQLIREDAAARAQWQWHQRLQENLHAQVEALPADVGLERLMARVRAERASQSWFSRLGDAWARFASGPALAAAAALIVVQAGVIGVLLSREQPSAEFGMPRALTPGEKVESLPVLQVSFKPDASERQIRLLFVQTSGQIVDGPTQLGDYLVRVPVNQIEAAKRQFEESHFVEAVTVLNWQWTNH